MSGPELMKFERKKRGWSQEKLAQKLHISRVTLGRYERGELSLDLDIIENLSKLFELPFLKCLGEEEKRIYRLKERNFLVLLRKEKYLYQEILDYPERMIEKLKKCY